jgi:hypothetical protein
VTRYRCVYETIRNVTKHAKPDPQPPPGKQAKPQSQLPSGRAGFDERGNAIWEWRTDSGTYKSNVDTQEVKAIRDSTGDSLSIAEEAPSQPVDHDPYSTAAPRQPFPRTPPPPEEKKPQRRTLDDMRRLSEEIKRQRTQKKPT